MNIAHATAGASPLPDRTPAPAAEWPQDLAAKYARSQAPLRLTRLSADILRLEGEISNGDGKALADQITPDTRTLLLNSAGGEVEAALEMAEIIAAARLRIVVDGACISSCANYLFAAADQQLILRGGVVLWHGAPARDSGSQVEAALRQALEKSGAGKQQVEADLSRELARLDATLRRQEALYADRRLNTAVLYRLNQEAADAHAVDGGSSKGQPLLFIGYAALRCAGLRGLRQAWIPADEKEWVSFLKASGLSRGASVTRSRNFEATICR